MGHIHQGILTNAEPDLVIALELSPLAHAQSAKLTHRSWPSHARMATQSSSAGHLVAHSADTIS
jgi:hypothetical protein